MMAVLTIIAGAAAVISLGGIIFILARKLPQTSIINIETIPKERELKIKQDLLLARLERRRARMAEKLSLALGPFWKLIRYGFERLITWAEELERAHKAKQVKKESGDSRSVAALLLEAERLSDNGDFDEAEEKYIEVIKIDSKNTQAYKGLGELYMAKRDYAHARETLEFLIKLGKADATIYADLGAVAREQGKLEEAKGELLRSISMESRLAPAYVDLGLVYDSMGEHERAVEAFARAVELEPANPRNLDLLLEESIIVGNKNLAEDAFLKLREANPENQKLREFKKRIDEIK